MKKAIAIFITTLPLIAFLLKKDLIKNQANLVKEVIEQRYIALNQLFTGKVEPMLALWSHSDEATYLGPTGGIKKGWQEIEKEWRSQAAMKLGGKVTGSDFHYNIRGDIAVVVNMETGENVDSVGHTQTVRIRATHVLQKENGEWKLISEHTDLLPFLD